MNKNKLIVLAVISVTTLASAFLLDIDTQEPNSINNEEKIEIYLSDDAILLKNLEDKNTEESTRESYYSSLEWAREYGVVLEDKSTKRLSIINEAYKHIDSKFSSNDDRDVGYSTFGFVRYVIANSIEVVIEKGLDTSPKEVYTISYDIGNTGDIYYNKEKDLMGIYLWDDKDKNAYVLACSKEKGKVCIEIYPKVEEFYRIVSDDL